MKRFICVSVLSAAISCCFAASITVLVNQRDVSGQTVFENTRIFEDGLINYFFETGSIVSNEPASLDAEYKGAYQAALDASKIGFIDYVAVFNVSIDDVSQNISEVHWILVQVRSGTVIDEGKISAPVISNSTDIPKGIMKFAEQNAALVSKAMAKKR